MTLAPAPALDLVVAGAAEHAVVAEAAEDAVVALAAEQHVRAASTLDVVVAAAALALVGAVGADHGLARLSAARGAGLAPGCRARRGSARSAGAPDV